MPSGLAEESSSARPQSLMFSFLGVYVLGAGVAVSSGSVIDVFGRVGVSEEAVRSTLARMVKRGLLARHRDGRRVYVGLTDRAEDVLEDGQARIWKTGAVNRDWDGTWTVVSFSLPDTRRRERHELRSRLVWEGFGPLHSGQWIAAGARPVDAVVAELGLAEHVTVLSSRAAAPTDDRDLVDRAFDTDAIAARYRAFVDRWGAAAPLPGLPDDLARQLVLHTDWLQLVRQDPHLPAQLLPDDWPAIRADEIFRELAAAYDASSALIADAVLDVIPVA
ncbi:phenylacetic acid degradation operon negative regulatory protein [Mumia flava]|uniref:Phenylacetic acid degradation operon negative regulatory protein n=2 Tax=Mumia flava TaxID=1348852 RepID=A0A0B2BB97_9ACTN|nr:phenylacetic acid degradation operon negative regulatory protein [Mumia flava]